MIDAYEIGIQLTLQDDVSAGLAAINRELAEVDRAIAATSANLGNLTQLAEGAGKAAVAGVSKRVATVAGPSVAEDRPEPANVPTSKSGGEQQAEPAASPAVVVAAGEAVGEAVAPTAPSGTVSVAEAKPSSANLPGETTAPSAPPAQEPAIVSAAPAVRAASEPAAAPTAVAKEFATELTQTDLPGVASSSPAPAAAVARAAAPEKAASAPRASGERVVTASIAQAVASRRVHRRVEDAPSMPAPIPMSGSEPLARGVTKAAAPWSGVETRVLAPATAGSERAAAPSARQQDRGEALGGTVMLDGHLVGYWLAEQMAKDASRPPSGTSFFDPRQTPAWTASGSL